MRKDGRDNLIPIQERATEVQKEIRSKGGKARAKKARDEKTMRDFAKLLGAELMKMPTPEGKQRKMTMAEAVVYSQYKQAIQKGNTKAATFLATLRGELEQNINLNNNQRIIQVGTPEDADKLSHLKDLGI